MTFAEAHPFAAPSAQVGQRIPLVDLSAQYATIQREIEPVVLDVLARGAFTLGEELRAFEAAFARYCGVPHAVGVGSGTDALYLALRALNLRPGDEVIVPSTTFAATAEAVAYCGAKPVFVDVTEDDLLVDPSAVAAAVTPRTVGLLPVHLYGLLADVEALGATAARHGLWMIEDAAQAHGATLPSGGRAGRLGTAGCFSF
jgi:dTDP-4-amino-4,6-dideoxygalactose transaminase